MKTLGRKLIHEKFIDDMISGEITDLESFIAKYIECENQTFIGGSNYKGIITFRNDTLVKVVKDYNRAIELASDFSTLIAYLKENDLILFKKELHKEHPSNAITVCETKTSNRPNPFAKFYTVFPEELFYRAIVDNGLKTFKKRGYRTSEEHRNRQEWIYKTIRLILLIISAPFAIYFGNRFLEYACTNKTSKVKSIKSTDSPGIQNKTQADTTVADSLLNPAK